MDVDRYRYNGSDHKQHYSFSHEYGFSARKDALWHKGEDIMYQLGTVLCDPIACFIFQTMQVSRAQDTVSEGRLALNSNLGSFFCLFKSIFSDNFLSLFRTLNQRIIHKKLFKLSYLNSNFALAPGYLNPALYNPARDLKVEMVRKTNRKIIMI